MVVEEKKVEDSFEREMKKRYFTVPIVYGILGIFGALYGLNELETYFRTCHNRGLDPSVAVAGLYQTYIEYVRAHPEYTRTTLYREFLLAKPKEWLSLKGQWNEITSTFAHGSLFHLLGCGMFLFSFRYMLAQIFRPAQFATVFVASGWLSGNIGAGLTWLRNGESGLGEKVGCIHSFQSLVGGREFDMRVWEGGVLGSSGALMALGSIFFRIMPAIELGIPLIPYGITLRYAIPALAAFDLGGYLTTGYGDFTRVDHAGHLGGYAAGLLIYGLWMRRVPQFRQFVRGR